MSSHIYTIYKETLNLWLLQISLQCISSNFLQPHGTMSSHWLRGSQITLTQIGYSVHSPKIKIRLAIESDSGSQLQVTTPAKTANKTTLNLETETHLVYSKQRKCCRNNNKSITRGFLSSLFSALVSCQMKVATKLRRVFVFSLFCVSPGVCLWHP